MECLDFLKKTGDEVAEFKTAILSLKLYYLILKTPLLKTVGWQTKK